MFVNGNADRSSLKGRSGRLFAQIFQRASDAISARLNHSFCFGPSIEPRGAVRRALARLVPVIVAGGFPPLASRPRSSSLTCSIAGNAWPSIFGGFGAGDL